MSYDLRLLSRGRPLDLEAARAALAGADGGGDELLWMRDALSATFLLTPEEIDVGVVGDDAPQAERARDFEELLRVLLGLAERVGARVHDPQLGRDLGPADVATAVRFFA